MRPATQTCLKELLWWTEESKELIRFPCREEKDLQPAASISLSNLLGK